MTFIVSWSNSEVRLIDIRVSRDLYHKYKASMNQFSDELENFIGKYSPVYDYMVLFNMEDKDAICYYPIILSISIDNFHEKSFDKNKNILLNGYKEAWRILRLLEIEPKLYSETIYTIKSFFEKWKISRKIFIDEESFYRQFSSIDLSKIKRKRGLEKAREVLKNQGEIMLKFLNKAESIESKLHIISQYILLYHLILNKII
ncbi:MAG: hypothetical protein DRJ34_01480 [Thermoprotei archaeon]|nr:MAG: hypothetical protein DRJ34_01480 [Thermoprotei archaeon]RLE72462.1 MAG: hypothetical protein DRJ45_01795 [Thermoprotei archaeon]